MPAFARRIAVVIAASATVLGAAACGGGVSKDKFTSELVKKAGLTEAQATCVTDKLYAELSRTRSTTSTRPTRSRTRARRSARR